ncbi:MAG TPA: NUDIX hydrolase [Burkholderiales bacterium]|jgi:8-oxo-dGTP pyrophosphatase MutT (NUDIX family)
MHLGKEATAGQVVAPRDAATVLLLRPTGGHFEVFMVKRSGLSDVLGEAHVFPGGKIDLADATPAMLAQTEGAATIDAVALNESLPAERLAALYVAAARETFEEAGVLLARGVGARNLAAARARLNAKEPFAQVLADEGIKLDLAALTPWVRWVTPEFLAKRFDVRFFLAVAPSEQTAVHDDYEAIHSEWVAPRGFMARWERNEIKLAPPTYKSLEHLALFDSIEDVLVDARSRPAPILMPHSYERDGVREIVLPGDPGHPVAQHVLPGPTRLRWDGARYAPA